MSAESARHHSDEFRIRLWLEDAICFSYHEAHTSEGQAARLLGVDRLSFRDIYQAWKIMGGRVPENHPLLSKEIGNE